VYIQGSRIYIIIHSNTYTYILLIIEHNVSHLKLINNSKGFLEVFREGLNGQWRNKKSHSCRTPSSSLIPSHHNGWAHPVFFFPRFIYLYLYLITLGKIKTQSPYWTSHEVYLCKCVEADKIELLLSKCFVEAVRKYEKKIQEPIYCFCQHRWHGRRCKFRKASVNWMFNGPCIA